MLAPHLVSRLARRLHAVYQARAARATSAEQAAWQRLVDWWQVLEPAGRRLELARSHGLELALPAVRADLCSSARHLRDALDQLRDALDLSAPLPPGVSFLIAELCQLEDEFGTLRIEWRRQVLTVTTAPVILEEVALGSFDIELVWPRLLRHCDVGCFDIVALRPNPAAGDESVTHPHVKDERLCPGQGSRALDRALEEGRLVDAFHLVRGVLLHYNPTSPYVALELWDGTTCADCGVTVSESDLSYCGGCEEALCVDCSGVCATCRSIACGDCSRLCAVCEEMVCSNCVRSSGHSDRNCCPSCVRACRHCGAEVAEDELDESTGRCPGCVTPNADHAAIAPSPDPSEPETVHDPSNSVRAAG